MKTGRESESIMPPVTTTSDRMSRSERTQLLSLIVDEFERRGWREDGHTALALVHLLDSTQATPTVEGVGPS
jgi:hypothetical protein